MKKILALLVSVLLLSIAVAFADFEPLPNTPYGIPVFDSPEAIDTEALLTIINGHGLQRMLDYFGSIEIVTDFENRANYSLKYTGDDCYFSDRGHYVSNHFTTSASEPGMNASRSMLLDTENPRYVTMNSSGSNEREITADTVLERLNSSIIPFQLSKYSIETLAARFDNEYYIASFNLKANETENSTEYTECMVEIDPETSLITHFEYHIKDKGGKDAVTADGRVLKTSPQDTVVSGEIYYGTNKEPDYSLFPDAELWINEHAELDNTEKDIPFAKAQDLQFVIPVGAIEAPLYAKIDVGDTIVWPKVITSEGVQSTGEIPMVCDVTVPMVTRSEPDEEGFLTYEIEYEADYQYYFDYDELMTEKEAAQQEALKICTVFGPFELYDYYTGRYLGNSDIVLTCPDDGKDVYNSVIEYSGKLFSIFVKEDDDQEVDVDEPSPIYNRSHTKLLIGSGEKVSGHIIGKKMVRVPEGYDGLILASRGPGERVPAYWDIVNYTCGEGFSVPEPDIHFWEGDPSNWVFIRIDDLLE